ncbi:hypothetical protein U1Q18_004745 [Sarracenia purpurea var. burkii]
MWMLNQSISGGDAELQDNLLDEPEGLCSFSPLQRIYGFAACLVAGLVLMLLFHAYRLFWKNALAVYVKLPHVTTSYNSQSLIVFAKPIKFAVLFTFGNMLAVGSTAFLIGPGQQIRMMLDPVRIYATAIYIGCVVLALICALWIHSKVLTILAIVSEICALIWYSLSYIPFARRVVSDMMIRLFDTEI